MKEFTFLNIEEIINKPINIIKRYGTTCTPTDFAILTGSISDSNYPTINSNTNTCSWWTASSKEKTDNENALIYAFEKNIPSNKRVIYVNDEGKPKLVSAALCDIKARPILRNVKLDTDDAEIYAGEYPQTVVEPLLNRILERKYKDKKVNKTKRNYTIMLAEQGRIQYYDKKIKFEEYEYEGNKYIRFDTKKIDTAIRKEKLSNGETIADKKAYWIKVEPIKWLYDKEDQMLVSEKALFSGVSYNDSWYYKGYKYDGDFSFTNIKSFMDDFFSKEININLNNLEIRKPLPKRKKISPDYLNEVKDFYNKPKVKTK